MRFGAFGAFLSALAIFGLWAGNFSHSCNGIWVSSGGQLSAQCGTYSGSYIGAGIDLNQKIANLDGVLSIVSWNGLFSHSCRNLYIQDNHRLVGECAKKNGQYVSASIDLDEYVVNNNGSLQWVSSAVAPIPHMRPNTNNTTTTIPPQNVAVE